MRIRAIESVLPEQLVTNDHMIQSVVAASQDLLSAPDLALLEKRIRTLFKNCGTAIRYHRAPHETALNLGIKAGHRALERSRLHPADIDLILYVGVGRGFIEPATATIFQSALGLVNATAFDILDACASWLRALQLADLYTGLGVYRNIMILNAEFNREYGNLRFKSVDDLDFRFASLTIGEAATATIVSASHEQSRCHFSFRTWGSENDLCKIPLPNHREYSMGERLSSPASLEFFSFSLILFRSAYMKLLEHYRSDRVLPNFKPDIMFGHAASDSMTMRIADRLGLDPTRVYLTHARFGNTVSASIPLGISQAIGDGKLLPGMNILLGCGSAGLTTCWACFCYQD